MKSKKRLLLLAPLALLLLAGCGQGGGSVAPAGLTGSSADEIEISQQLSAHAELVEDEGLSAPFDETSLAQVSPSSGLLARVEEAIVPLVFWRTIRDVDRRYEFEFADFDTGGRPWTAIVTIHKRLRGGFHIATVDSVTPDSVVRRLVHKPLEDHWVRRVLLRRMRLATHDRAVWRIVATTGVEVTSRSATTEIVSLRIQTADLDTTITNPLEFFRLRHMLRVDAEMPVRLTVTTTRDDDIVLLYGRHGRFRFHNNGDGTYVGVWRSPMLAGPRHVGVNALSRGTLFDDAEPYDSNAWILPYLVEPHRLDDFAP